MFPSRAIRGLIFALLALVSALDGYAACAVPIWAKEPGYAQHSSHANAALTLAALATMSTVPDRATLRTFSSPNL